MRKRSTVQGCGTKGPAPLNDESSVEQTVPCCAFASPAESWWLVPGERFYQAVQEQMPRWSLGSGVSYAYREGEW